MSLTPTPLTLREARAYVARHHRHHGAPQGGFFAVGATCDGEIVGVAIVGRPVARRTDGTRNACSLLYGACWRAARALGYRRLVTYTLPQEGGASLRGAGWRIVGECGGGSWSRRSRPRVDTHPTQRKLRWERTA